MEIMIGIIVIYLAGYYCGRFTTRGWYKTRDVLPRYEGYYLVTLDNERYARILYWDGIEGWCGDKSGRVVAWRENIKGAGIL